MMSSLEDVVCFLHMLSEEKPGCPVEELKKFAALKQLSRPLDFTQALLESFSSSLKKLCEWDSENKTHFITVLLERGLQDVLFAVFEGAIENQNQEDASAKSLCIMDTICAISSTSAKAKTTLVKTFGIKFLHEILRNISTVCTVEAVKRVNLLLEHCPLSVQDGLLQDAEIVNTLQKVSELVYTAGDYEIQIGVLECLFRFIPSVQRKNFSCKFFSDPSIAKHFLSIKVSDFETDCRQFLNQLNCQLQSSTYPRVISLPCLTASLGEQELKKPEDPNSAEFWVDFNTGSSRITLFCEQELCDSQGEGTVWEIVSIFNSNVHSYNLEVEKDPVVLTLSLKTTLEKCVPFVCAGQREKYATLSFEPKLAPAVTEALISCFSEELNWAKLKRKPSKVSTAVTPIALNIRQACDLVKPCQVRAEVVTSSLQSEYGISETDHLELTSNDNSLPMVSEDTVEKEILPRTKEKVSVLAQELRTPARLTYPEIHNSLYQATTDSNSDYDYKNASPGKGTSSKYEPKSAESLNLKLPQMAEVEGKKGTISEKTKGSGNKTKQKDQKPPKKESKSAKSKSAKLSRCDSCDFIDLKSAKGKGTSTPRTPIVYRTRSSRGKVKTPLILQVTPKRTHHKKSSKLPQQYDLEIGVNTKRGHEEKIEEMVFMPELKEITNPEDISAECSVMNVSGKACYKKNFSEISVLSEIAGKSQVVSLRHKSEADPLIGEVESKIDKPDKKKKASRAALSTDSKMKRDMKTRFGNMAANTSYTTKNNVKANEKTICKRSSQAILSLDKKSEDKQAEDMPDIVPDSLPESLECFRRNVDDHRLILNDLSTKEGENPVTAGISTKKVATKSGTSSPGLDSGIGRINDPSIAPCDDTIEEKDGKSAVTSSIECSAIFPRRTSYLTKPKNNRGAKTSNEKMTVDPYDFEAEVESNVGSTYMSNAKQANCKPKRIFTAKKKRTLVDTTCEITLRSEKTKNATKGICKDVSKKKKSQNNLPHTAVHKLNPFEFGPSRNMTSTLEMIDDPLQGFSSYLTNPDKSNEESSPKVSPQGSISRSDTPLILHQKIEERVYHAAGHMQTSPDLDTHPESLTSKLHDIIHDNISDRATDGRMSRRRKCKTHVTNYREISDSDEENLEGGHEVIYTTPCSFQSYAEPRTEVSWVQPTSKKHPDETYLLKPGFDFKALARDSYQTKDTYDNYFRFEDDFKHDDDEPEVTSECISLIRIVPDEALDEKTNSQASSEKKSGDEKDAKKTPGLAKPGISHLLNANEDSLSLSLKDQDKTNSEKNHGLKTPDICDLSSGDNPSLSLEAQTEKAGDQKDLGYVTPTLHSSWNDYEENKVFSPEGEDLTASISPVSLLSDRDMDKFSGYISAYSSATRLPKSELKRKYRDGPLCLSYLLALAHRNDPEASHQCSHCEFSCEEIPEDNSESSECVEEECYNLVSPPIPRRKLFKFDTEPTNQSSQIRSVIQGFGIELEKQMKEKFRRLDSLIKDATKGTHTALKSMWEQQFEIRSQLRNSLREDLLNEVLGLQKDIDHLKEEETATANFYKRQMDELKKLRESQALRLRNLKRLHRSYEQGISETDSKEKQLQTSTRKTLERELVILHKATLQNFQQQEMRRLRHSLKNMI